MHRRVLAISTALFVTVLTGCAAPATTPNPTPSATPGASSTPSASLTPIETDELVISLDGVTDIRDGISEEAAFASGQDVLDMLEAITGVMPDGVPIDDPPGYEFGLTRYDWDGLRVIVPEEGAASIAVTAAALDGVPLRTETGLAVGSTSEDVLAAGGWEIGDLDGDGVVESFGIASREVPGTESLARPGSVGIDYILLLTDGEAVTQIQSPANDYSDI